MNVQKIGNTCAIVPVEIVDHQQKLRKIFPVLLKNVGILFITFTA